MAPKFTAFSPKAFQFWSSTEARPKRMFEAMLIFPDLIFGGDGMQNIEPYLVSSFSRPGYSRLDSETGEYQMKSGDFSKIEYPTGGYRTSPIRVELLDVVNHNKGANTAAAVHTSLTMLGATLEYEEKMMGVDNDGKLAAEQIQKTWTEFQSTPRFSIIEFDNKGQTVGEWKIQHPVLTAANFSEVNYKSGGFATITLSFDYKNFSYDSSWGDKLLRNRVEMLGKERNAISKALDKGAENYRNAMRSESAIKNIS